MAKKVKNFRDLGGIPAADGKTVRYGKLYRSGHLGKINEESAEKLRDQKNLATVVDLRAPAELSHRQDVIPEGAGPGAQIRPPRQCKVLQLIDLTINILNKCL